MRFLKTLLILFLLASCKDTSAQLEYIEIIPNNPTSLVFVLHGYGSNNQDLLSLAQELSKSFPNTAFVLPNAPNKAIGLASYGLSSKGYQWFSLNKPEFIMRKEAKQSNKILNSFIKNQSKRLSIENENIIISGFSQGGIMSMYNGLRQKDKVTGVISFSGLLADDEQTLKKQMKSKPKILMINGTNDNIVEYSNLEKAVNIFNKLEIPNDPYTLQGVGHTINQKAILKAREFIESSL